MDVLGSTILESILTGVVASFTFYVILLFIRPKLKVSSQISCRHIANNTDEYKIKLVNKTFSMLYNVRYVLYYCIERDDGIHDIEEIQPLKTPLTSITGYSLKRDNTDYAVRITYIIDNKKYVLNEKTKLIFVIMCNHSLSNTSKCIRMEYRVNDIKEGMFETDKSMKIISNESCYIVNEPMNIEKKALEV